MRKIIIDNIHNGYNTHKEKIPPIKQEIESLLGEPLFTNERALRIEQGGYSRQLRYHHKLFKKNGVSVIILYIGETEYKWFSDMEIHIDTSGNSTDAETIIEKIQSIMQQYPHVQDTMTEYAYYAEYKSCPICGNNFDKDEIGWRRYAAWHPYICQNCGWNAKKARTIPQKMEVATCEH